MESIVQNSWCFLRNLKGFYNTNCSAKSIGRCEIGRHSLNSAVRCLVIKKCGTMQLVKLLGTRHSKQVSDS